MRLSKVLNAQHLGFMFKKHWFVQGTRVPIDTGVEDYLKSKGIPVEDALEFVKEKPVEEHVEIVGPYKVPPPLNKSHPNYKEQPCYTLKHTTVLLEGLSQAQALTKTVIADETLPSKIEELAEIPAPKAVHEGVKKAILSANVFDCEQKKLPKIKDPARPAHGFARPYGITDRRRNEVITNKLVQLVERSSDTEISLSKFVMNNVQSNVVFNKEDELIQFQDLSNILLTSNKPVKHDALERDVKFIDIPDLYPVKPTIALTSEHFYNKLSKYPISPTVTIRHPHTTWLHYNKTEVLNLYEEPVTQNQILGRSLTHAFTVASSYAKQLHGEDVQDLPEPIFVNCIQTDGQNYHFGIFKLNTLNVDGSKGTKNVWYSKNNMKLYDSSKYFSGMPVLENYNPKVYGYINAFYNC